MKQILLITYPIGALLMSIGIGINCASIGTFLWVLGAFAVLAAAAAIFLFYAENY